MNVLTLQNVCFGYRKSTRILENISFELRSGEIMGLLGHNGSGKSTLLKLLAGLRRPDNGAIKWNEVLLRDYAHPSRNNLVGLMLESPALYPHLTVGENLEIITRFRKLDPSRAQEALQVVGMKERMKVRSSKLSTGMKQRTVLASILMAAPELYLLDEPTSGMDPEGIASIRAHLKMLASRGAMMIISSHQLAEIQKIADKVMILKNGRQIFWGDVHELEDHQDLESFYLEQTLTP